jgi:hypothetical protein
MDMNTIDMQRPIDASTPITITMVAGEWDLILQALDLAPMPKRFTAPLDAKIKQAVMTQAGE